ncbi:hypothetical protein BJ508DRAFT_381605 [Ascobolus immersus RN42]|uniref:Uncharacterized protein n=1 Tax=Ascobolus immersus RN42 TaxID=1160509 RepID=A0A3N4HDK8_ASCIM|nr:hypothetical protein BJ508DRAFT_381605 [Ascobolus immersus RN42]
MSETGYSTEADSETQEESEWTIGRILLELFATLSHLHNYQLHIYNHHSPSRDYLTPSRLRTALNQEAELLLPLKQQGSCGMWYRKNFTAVTPDFVRSIRPKTPVTNILLDWFEGQFEGFQPWWMLSVLVLEKECLGDRWRFPELEVLYARLPEMREWDGVCDKMALEYRETAARSSHKRWWYEERASALEDLKSVLGVVGPFVDREKGGEYVDDVLQASDACLQVVAAPDYLKPSTCAKFIGALVRCV